MAFISGCSSDNNAIVERKESFYYGRSGVVRLVTVEQGDSLEGIAAEYGVTVPALAKVNNLNPDSKLSPGQVIKVPDASALSIEEELYDSSHKDIVEEIPLYEPESEQKNAADAYNLQPSEGEIKGGGYLGSIKGPLDTSNHPIVEEEHLFTSTDIQPIKDNVASKNNVPSAEVKRSDNFKLNTPRNSQNFMWPINGEIVSRYGSSGNKFNEGVNIAAPTGTPVKAIASGSVIYTGKEPKVYGNLVIIKHNDGYLSAYAHNDVILVRKGAKVNQGDIIAKVGKTGSVQSPQLHFSLRKDKKTVDPEQAE